MKKLLLCLFLVAGMAYAGGIVARTDYATNALAGRPDAGNTFAPLNGGKYFRVIVKTDAGTTFTGGTMRCYFQDGYVSGIQRCLGADFTLDPLDAGTVTSPSYATGVEYGNVFYAPDSVTTNATDAGGAFGVTIEVQP